MRFILTFALTSIFLSSALYGLILAVDPYNKFGYNLFNLETKAVDFARENKFNQVEHAKKSYDLFLMGSSSAHRYMTKEMNRLTGMTSYNYTTQSATPEDFIAMTRHILKKKFPVKLIMISMDFEALSANTKTDDMFFSSPLKDYLKEVPADELEADLFNNSYLTLEAISDSFKVIWVNLFGKAEHSYLEDGDHIVEPTAKTLKVKQFHYSKYSLDLKRLNYLRTIKELGDTNGFKVLVFTSPLSQGHMDKINADPKLKANLLNFKMALVDIFGEVHDFENDGNRPFNTLQYFRDSNHPTHEFSTMVLERIFGKEMPGNPEFGQVLK
jgi:hypothetical protein